MIKSGKMALLRAIEDVAGHGTGTTEPETLNEKDFEFEGYTGGDELIIERNGVPLKFVYEKKSKNSEDYTWKPKVFVPADPDVEDSEPEIADYLEWFGEDTVARLVQQAWSTKVASDFGNKEIPGKFSGDTEKMKEFYSSGEDLFKRQPSAKTVIKRELDEALADKGMDLKQKLAVLLRSKDADALLNAALAASKAEE